jgi:phage shock protein PspC (stress-responsive transcriptional regulator)
LANGPRGGSLDAMNETTERPTEPLPPGPKRLTRSRDDRVVGGVCGGMGRYFNVDPLFFRIGAVALAFVGGAGLLLYLAALVLVPSEDQPTGQPAKEQRNRGLLIVAIVVGLIVAFPFLFGGGLVLAAIGIPLAVLVATGVLVWWLVSGEGPAGDAGDIARRAALGVGVLIVCAVIAILGVFVTAVGPGWLIPAFVVLAGVAIVGTAFVRPLRWLVLPAITLALAGGFVAAADIHADGGISNREYRPASTVDMRDKYELGIGQLVVDLRDTDLPAGDVPLKLDVGIGEARLIVPDDVCVATDGEVGVGDVSLFGRNHGGVDVDYEDLPDAPAGATRLLLKGNVGLGQLVVRDARGEFFDDFDPLEERPRQEACAALVVLPTDLLNG